MRKVQFAPNCFYHLYNRGVEKRDIFRNESDYWRFLQGLWLFNDEKTSIHFLWDIERKYGQATFKTIKEFFATSKTERKPLVRILTDCLMPNHYHLLVEELVEGGISKFMHKLGTGYSLYINNKYERTGSLFEGTFKAVMVDNDLYLQYLLVYINVLNPLGLIEPDFKGKGIKDLARAMRFSREYPWSAHREYLGQRESHIIDKGLLGEVFSKPEDYERFVLAVLKEKKFMEIESFFLE